MNYQKVYVELCLSYQAKSLSKDKSKPGSMELHHILPIACGGLNTKNNLVLFPLKAHFLAHHLLKKIYKGTQYEIPMDNAFNLMCNTKTDYHSGKTYGVRVTMKVYENAKLDAAKHKIGDANPAKRPEVRIKLSQKSKGRPSAKKGKKSKPLSQQQRQQLSNTMHGRIWITNGIKSFFVKGDDPRIGDDSFYPGRILPMTEEAFQNRSKAHKGKSNPQNHRKHSQSEIDKQAEKMRQLVWVTNGKRNLRVKKDEIPPGFSVGRKLKKVCIDLNSLNAKSIAELPRKTIMKNLIPKTFIKLFLVCEKDGMMVCFHSAREAELKTGISRFLIPQLVAQHKCYNGYKISLLPMLDKEVCQKFSDRLTEKIDSIRIPFMTKTLLGG